jgi:N-terminal domain of reverse transcriptase
MTIDLHGSIGASSTESPDWKSLPWDKARQEVRRLQMRIAKAIKELDCRITSTEVDLREARAVCGETLKYGS